MRELTAIVAIAHRDLLKFVRDPVRMVSTFVFPLIFIGALGGSLQAAFGGFAEFNLLTFRFTGVFAQTLALLDRVRQDCRRDAGSAASGTGGHRVCGDRPY